MLGKPSQESANRSGVAPRKRRDRGQSTQIDFIFSMSIRITALVVAIVGGMTILGATAPQDYSGRVAAKRAADRLVDDLLVSSPGQAVLDRACTKAYFQTDTTVCGFSSDWTDGDGDFLHDSLVVDHQYQLNVTIERPTGKVVELDGETLAAGPDTSEVDDRTIHTWYRRKGLDANGDGDPQLYTVYVRVWKP